MPTALVVMGAKGVLSIFISIRDFQRKALCHNREVFALATFECPYFASVPHHRYGPYQQHGSPTARAFHRLFDLITHEADQQSKMGARSASLRFITVPHFSHWYTASTSRLNMNGSITFSFAMLQHFRQSSLALGRA